MRTARIAWAAAGLSTVLAVGYAVLLFIDVRGGYAITNQHWLPTLVWIVAWPMLAAVVLSKHPRNRVAWIFVVVGLGSGAAMATQQYGIHGAVVEPGSLPGVSAVVWAGLVLGDIFWFPFITLVPQLFPDGRPLSARWRWLVRLTLLLVVAHALLTAVRPGRLDPTVPIRNPFGVRAAGRTGWLGITGSWVVLPACAVVAAGALASLLLRLRRARGALREQMRFFVFAIGVTVVTLAVEAGYESGTILAGVPSSYAFVARVPLALVAPVAFGVAITRYRLYDIDRIISRTVSYALVTGLLAITYFAVVTGVTGLVPSGSSAAVAGATLAVAALFHPLRRRVQLAVDRRFNRARYDAQQAVDAFSLRLRSEVGLEAVRADLLAVVRTTMQPSVVGLWLRDDARSG
ncbi:MAG: hypothetical protein ABR520_11655 [Mycobacteriales bacterium]|nr:hypothetical protein [Frankia sp.]